MANVTAFEAKTQEHGLSVYDATYLELAIRKRLPLATRDAKLNKAAQHSGVTTLVSRPKPPRRLCASAVN